MSHQTTVLTPRGAQVTEVLAYGLTNHPCGAGRLAAVLVEHLDGHRSVEVIPVSTLIVVSVPWRLDVLAEHRPATIDELLDLAQFVGQADGTTAGGAA